MTTTPRALVAKPLASLVAVAAAAVAFAVELAGRIELLGFEVVALLVRLAEVGAAEVAALGNDDDGEAGANEGTGPVEVATGTELELTTNDWPQLP